MRKYVMIYMSMSSVIIWGIGMPWFRRRNQRKAKRQALEMLPPSGAAPKDIVEAEKARVQGDVIVTPSAGIPFDNSKKPLAKSESQVKLLSAINTDTDDDGEYRADGPPSDHAKARAQRMFAAFRKSYFFEVLTLPPVIAMTSSLLIAFIPPLRHFLLNTYASVIPNTAAFVGDASIPIIIMFLGSNLAENSKNNVVVPKKLTIPVVITRLIVLPTVGVSLVYGLIKLGLLPDDVVLRFLIMLQFAMPAAVNLILACQIAGGGEEKMSALLFWQYVFCAFTVSVFCIIIQIIVL